MGGGAFDAFGKEVTLTGQSRVDASGKDGGYVRIGGDWQGTGDAPHADRVTVALGAAIHADARERGDGGTVVVWSDGTTQFDGAITARGGARGGDGGKVETSGHVLRVGAGSVDAAAANGQGGAWLLDPYDITIRGSADSNISSSGNKDFVSSGDSSNLSVATLNSALNNGTNVSVKTGVAGSPGTQAGRITVDAAISKTAGGDATLTLDAYGSLAINADISSVSGKLNLNIDAAKSTAGGSVTLKSDATISTNGGNVQLYRGTVGNAIEFNSAESAAVNLAGNITTDGGAIKVYGQNGAAGAGVFVGGTLSSNGGEVIIHGASSDGTGVDITGGKIVDAGDVSLAGDTMSFGDVVAGMGTASLQRLTSGKISLGSGGDGLQLNSFGKLSGFSQLVIGDAKTSELAVNGVTLAMDAVLHSSGAVNITDGLNAGNYRVTLESGAASGGGGVITAGTLDLRGNAYTLNGANAVGSLIGDAQSVQFTNAGDLQVGTDDADLKIKGNSSLNSTSGSVTVANAVTAGQKADLTITAGQAVTLQNALASQGGKISLTAQNGAITLTDVGEINSGAGDIALRATTALPTAGRISGKGTLTLDHADHGTIGIGSAASDALKIDPASFGADKAFDTKFKEIIIGSAATGDINVAGAATFANKLTVNSGGTVSLAADSALKTTNQALTIHSRKLQFAAPAGTSALAAGSGALTLHTDAITNWAGADFAGGGGALLIAPRMAGNALTIGGATENGSTIAVTQAGLDKIAAGSFSGVTIGSAKTENGIGATTGAVTLYELAQTTGSTDGLKQLTVNGDAATIDGNITNADGQTLTLHVNGLTQNRGALAVGGLLAIDGTNGSVTLNQTDNAVAALTMQKVQDFAFTGKLLGVGTAGVTTTGKIDLKLDAIAPWAGKITAGGDFTLQTTGNAIDLGTSSSSGLCLSADDVARITANGITIGNAEWAGTINVGQAEQDTKFNSLLHLLTKNASSATDSSVNLNGNVYVGTANPYKDLWISTWSMTWPTELYVHDLYLDIGKGLANAGGVVHGTGDLSIAGPSADSGDVYISNNDHSREWTISYTTLNDVFTGFKGFSLATQNNIILEEGALNKSVKLTAGTLDAGHTVASRTHTVQISGDVTIGGDQTEVYLNGADFTVNKEKSLKLTGTGGKVEVGAAMTTLAADAGIDVGGGSFTLSTNALTAVDDSATNIVGGGALKVQQLTNAAMNIDSSGSGLHITNDQINGALFGGDFSSLTLGNAGVDAAVKIDGASISNNVTIQTGAGGTLTVASGGLTVNDGKAVTLRGGTISNSNGAGAINAGTGTINFYTDDFSNLKQGDGGDAKVTGTGALGIGTYAGTKQIYLGSGGGADDLQLGNDFFSGVFGADFTDYRIGSAAQIADIHVSGAELGKNLTLTGADIIFTADESTGFALELQGSGANKNLVINAHRKGAEIGHVYQQGYDDATDIPNAAENLGITAADVELTGQGEFDLNAAANRISGTLSGDALRVNVASDQLKVGAIEAKGGAIILSADAMTFEGASLYSTNGILTLQQLKAGSPMQIGGDKPGSGLFLGADLFNGVVAKDGFTGVYLGRMDGENTVRVAGALNFVDDTYIRSAAASGGIVIGPSTITTQGNALKFESGSLKSEADANIDVATGNLTFTTTEIDLVYGTKIIGSGNLTLEAYSKAWDKAIYLGGNGPGTGNGLWLRNYYFENGENRVFGNGFQTIILGNEHATTKLTQSGTIDFTNNVVIRQAASNSSGGYEAKNTTIETAGKNFSVESQNAVFDNVHVKAGAGNISIKTDWLDLKNGTHFEGSGGLALDTYSPNKQISIGGEGGLKLEAEWFAAGGAFGGVSGGISIGSAANTGGIVISDKLVTNQNLSLATQGTITDTSSGGIEFSGSGGHLDLQGSSITLDEAQLTNIGTLTATASNGAVEVKQAGNTIAQLGDIKGQRVTIESAGDVSVVGTVEATQAGQDVSITAHRGNLTIENTGTVRAQHDVYLTTKDTASDTEGWHFTNNNGTDAISAGNRWVVHTFDSLGDDYGGLTGDFRKYGTTDSGIPTTGSGSVHVWQPTAKLYAEKTYGDANSQFFDNGKLTLTINDRDGGVQRECDDTAFLGSTANTIFTGKTDALSYGYGSYVQTFDYDGIKMAVNKNIGGIRPDGTHIDGLTYGTGNIAEKQITYLEKNNALNYKVDVEFWVTPKTVTVKANDVSKIYDGIKYTGGSSVTYKGWANGENETNAGIKAGTIVKYGGSAQDSRNAGDFTIDIQASDLCADNYIFAYENGTLHVDKRAITVTTDNASRVYGDANPTNLNGKVDGGTSLGQGDSIESIGVAISGVDERSNAGSTGAVQVNSVVINDGNGGNNYTVTKQDGTLTVTKRKITVTADGDGKIYGENNPLLNQTKFSVGDKGLVNGDQIDTIGRTLDSSITQFTDAGTHSGKVLALADSAHFSSGNVNNYEITYVGGDFTIGRRQLVITAGDIERVYGDANPALNRYTVGAFGTGTGLVNGDEVGSVNLAYDGAINQQTHAGRYDGTISASDAALSRGNIANYNVQYVEGNTTITPRKITVSATGGQREYGAANPSQLSGAVTAGDLANGDRLGAVTVNTAADQYSNVGDYAVTPNGVEFSQGLVTDYDIDYVNGTLKVTKRKITVTADGDGKIYGENNPLLDQTKFSVGGSGLVNNDKIDTIGRTLDTSITQFTDAGTHSGKVLALADSAHFSSGNVNNYEITYVGGDFTIGRRQLVITAGDIERVYGDANPALNRYTVGAFGTGTGLVNGDKVGSVDLAYDADAINQQTHAGRYDDTIFASNAALSHGNLDNYNVQYVKGNTTITPRKITVSATGGQREYGAANPSQLSGAVTAGNLVNGDKLGAVTVNTTADQYSNVGDYAVTPNGVEFSQGLAADYDIDYADGKLTVLKKKVTVTANDASKVYDGLGYVVGTHGVHYDGFVNGQNEQVISGSTLYYGGAADGAKDVLAGGYEIGLTGDLKAQNYDFDYKNGTLDITKKRVTVTANSYDKTYDGQTYHSGGGYQGDQIRYDGFVAGEDQTKITGGDVSFGGAAQNAVDAGRYEIALDGDLSAQNYDFGYENGALEVRKKNVIVTANDDSKTYDGNAYNGGNGILSYVGFIGGDSAVNALTGGSIVYGSGDAAGAVNAGNYVIGIQDSDLTARNYDFTYADGTLTVTKKMVTVTADDFSKVYDGLGYVVGTHGVHYDGFIAGQDERVIDGGALHYGGAADGAKDVLAGGYEIALAGSDLTAKNYDFDYQSGTLIITPKRLVVTANDDRKAQSGIPYQGGNGVRYDGFAAGDDESVLGGALIYGGGAQGATNVGNYDITAGGLDAQNYTIDYAPGNLQIYTQGIDTAVDTVQNVTQPKADAEAAETAPDTVINKRPEPLPSLMGDIDPSVPAMNVEGMVSIVDIEAAKDFPQGNMDLQVQGSAENHHLYADRSGFGIVFEGGELEGFDPAHSKTDGAIPFLFTDSVSLGTDHEQTLEGFYSVSCTPGKLSIEPAPQGETTPRRSEIGEPELRQDYGVAYQDETAGSFQVGISNGIVTIQPKDDAAVETVNNAAKAPQRAVLTAGVLRAVRDFGVAPDQLRAVYVFRDKQVLGAQARKG